jgi:hypothetical protein
MSPVIEIVGKELKASGVAREVEQAGLNLYRLSAGYCPPSGRIRDLARLWPGVLADAVALYVDMRNRRNGFP